MKETLPIKFDDQDYANPERGTKDRALSGLFKFDEIQVLWQKKEEWAE